MKSFLVFLVSLSAAAGNPQGGVPQGEVKPLNDDPENSKQSKGVCLTPGCVKTAATLLEMINPEMDPCEDFYEFACGTFIKETTIPDDKTSIGSFTVLGEKLNMRLRKLFESSPKPDEPKVFKSVRKYFSACMDEDNIEKTGRQELLRIINELGGWPTLQEDQWNQDNFSFHALEEVANRIGLFTGVILSFGISTNLDNSTRRIMEVDQPGLGLDREYLIKGFEDKDVQAYYSYMVDTAVYLGAQRKVAEDELKESLMFELKIAEITLPQEERRNTSALNNQMTIEEGNKLYPGFNWTQHINNMHNSLEVPLTSNEVINVAVPKYIIKLAEYLPTVSARVQSNYQVWRYIKSILSLMDKEVRQIQLKFSKALTGKEELSPRWETCVKATSSKFYFYEGSLTNAIGSMYAKEYFPESSKLVAEEMVNSIKDEFKLMLDELEWMDAITKSAAQTKVDKMAPIIGYAREIVNNTLINEFYEGLNISSTSYLQNYLDLLNYISNYYIREFRKPIDNQSWKNRGGAAVVNAFYSSKENSIKFPAGILDGIFFKDDRPSYMNYGAIGSVVGHEITHGFDDRGSQKNGDGNLVNWWQQETKQTYLQRAQCIIEQYGNFTVDVADEVLNVNGINTQGENIADNGGFKQAYRAYERLVKMKGEELSLPGLPYTHRQLFWLSGASIWCSSIRDEALKSRVLTDPHSPSRFRVNGSFRNQKEFSKDWNCPSESPMNPEKKCTVW